MNAIQCPAGASDKPGAVQPPCSAIAIVHRITQYLCVGGLVNPEMREHEKVRDLLIDVRDYLLAGGSPNSVLCDRSSPDLIGRLSHERETHPKARPEVEETRLPEVMKCEGCGRFTRTEDLTPDYDLILLCDRCLEKLRSED